MFLETRLNSLIALWGLVQCSRSPALWTIVNVLSHMGMCSALARMKFGIFFGSTVWCFLGSATLELHKSMLTCPLGLDPHPTSRIKLQPLTKMFLSVGSYIFVVVLGVARKKVVFVRKDVVYDVEDDELHEVEETVKK